VSRTSLAAAVADVAARDPALAHLVALAGPLQHRPRDPDGHFGALVRAIVFQQLAGSAARAIHGRVRAAVRGPLTPEALASVPDEILRGAGLSANKLASLRDLSSQVISGAVDLNRSSRRSDDEIVAALVTVRGIGRWTAEMYLLFELRRLDVWPVDDLGVRQGYALAWRVEPAPTARELDPLGDRFVLAEDSALLQHRVHQRGFAVVHVRNDGYVPEVHLSIVAFSMPVCLIPVLHPRPELA
jgi:3-methyladenine DNA glycosylase/8-oxoguanine DNA glycosylase